MANAIYPKFREALLNGSVNLNTADVRFILVDTNDYTYSATHNALDDIPAAARVAVTTAGVGSKTMTNGTFDCADIVWSAVTGDEAEAIVGYIHSGNESTSTLMVYMDTGVTNLPVLPNGSNINCQWNAAGVFSI